MAFAVPNPKAMLADRGYDSDWFRQDLLLRGILPVIPSRKAAVFHRKQTGGVTKTAIALSGCSINSSRCGVLQPATTKPPCPS